MITTKIRPEMMEIAVLPAETTSHDRRIFKTHVSLSPKLKYERLLSRDTTAMSFV